MSSVVLDFMAVVLLMGVSGTVSSEDRVVSSEDRVVSSEDRVVSSEDGLVSSEDRAVSSEDIAVSSEDSVSACPSCGQVKTTSEDLVETVKRHILNVLHLNARPNVTQTLPRAALLNAVRKLHVDHVTEDGRVGDVSAAPGPSEVIVFAEPGVSADTVTFDISQDVGGASTVEEASVWIFVKTSKGNRTKAKVQLLLRPAEDEDKDEEDTCVSEKTVDTGHSGWFSVPVPRCLQTLLDGGHRTMTLNVSCPLCVDAGASPVLTSVLASAARRPFLMVALRAQETQQRQRRGLECDGEKICCKRHFYVDFKDIGWSDWIIAPSGYHANYCEGDCSDHMSALGSSSMSFHSAVVHHYRLRDNGPLEKRTSCCVPTRLHSMSMLYYSEDQRVVKKDVKDMIVDECGCS